MYLKIQDQGYKKLARDVEERTGQESFDSQAHEIRNCQYYDEIHHEHSLNHCHFTLKSFLHKNGGFNREGVGLFNFWDSRGGLDRAFTVFMKFYVLASL